LEIILFNARALEWYKGTEQHKHAVCVQLSMQRDIESFFYPLFSELLCFLIC